MSLKSIKMELEGLRGVAENDRDIYLARLRNLNPDHYASTIQFFERKAAELKGDIETYDRLLAFLEMDM